MHTSHWGLEKSPFHAGSAEPLFYAGLPQQEALARLRFLIHNQRRLGLVQGEPGAGKSLLVELFAEECRGQNWAVARLNLLGISVREFHWQLALALQAAPRVGDDSLELLRRWEARLKQHQLLAEPTIILLDDAEQAGVDVLMQLTRLVQLPPSAVGNLTLILTAQPQHVGRLGNRLLELVDLPIELEPWDCQDTTGYIQIALIESGCERPLFEESALETIHRLTRGVPRQVNRLADFALLAAANAELELIDSHTVAEAHAELTTRTRR